MNKLDFKQGFKVYYDTATDKFCYDTDASDVGNYRDDGVQFWFSNVDSARSDAERRNKLLDEGKLEIKFCRDCISLSPSIKMKPIGLKLQI